MKKNNEQAENCGIMGSSGKRVFQYIGDAEILKYQDIGPYFESNGVEDLLKANNMETTRAMALSMFMMGYIEGKRAERARKRGELI